MLFYRIALDIPEGYQKGPCVLRSATTTDGLRVVSPETIREFDELFLGRTLRPLDLSADDFPAPKSGPPIG